MSPEGPQAVRASNDAVTDGREGGLDAELRARIAEAEWLKSHYDEQLRAAFAQVATLQARLRAGAPMQGEPSGAELDALRSEVKQLRAELKRLSAAEQRYLDRIDELKGERALDG
jgi:chromosome segregation ATPase